MKNKITEVYCYYTGGGIYIYSAKYGNAYLYGTLDQTIDCFAVRGEILFQDEDSCECFGWTEEMNAFADNSSGCDPFVYYIKPSDIEYPTWQDVLDSLNSPELIAEHCADADETLMYWNPILTKRTYEEE